MTIIDGHVHLWSHDTARYPDVGWKLNGESRLPQVNGEADGLVERMDASGVSYALNVQVPWYLEDNRYHHDAVKRFPGRFAFLCVIDLDTPGGGERLERMVQDEGAQGFRIHLVEKDRLEKLLAGEHDAVLAAARLLDVPVQLLARAEHMPAATYIARKFEGLRIVVDHLCHPNPDQAPDYDPWNEFFALADYPRSYVKVSLQVNLSKAPWPHSDLHGFTKRVLDRFTPQRCLWGSNYPLIPEDVNYDRILAIVRDELPFLTGDDLAQVLGGTAATLWQPQTGSAE
jgi:predicted TIM-barrel fold metal-dependent hydrolase